MSEAREMTNEEMRDEVVKLRVQLKRAIEIAEESGMLINNTVLRMRSELQKMKDV